MPSLFLSYRREDSAGFAGRLADVLENRFGAGSVFRDVDDIGPGEDFVQAIQARLAEVGAVLVMIGPRWLTAAGADGRRRLDDPEDFVRREIQVALDAGTLVIPLLVGGAAMPAEAELPAALAGLARRQAVVLSDTGWKGDVARLVESLAPLLPGAGGARRRPWWLGLAGAAAVLLALGYGFQSWRPPPAQAPAEESATASVPATSTVPPAAEPPAPAATPAPAPRTQARAAPRPTRPPLGQGPAPAQAVPPALEPAGRWTARVKYDWGDEHDEVFEFKWLGQELRGTASYLTGRRPIEQVRLEGEWLNFVTRTQEMLGSDSPWKEVTHRYTGQITPEGIRFTLESGGGYTLHTPVEFTARRVAGH